MADWIMVEADMFDLRKRERERMEGKKTKEKWGEGPVVAQDMTITGS